MINSPLPLAAIIRLRICNEIFLNFCFVHFHAAKLTLFFYSTKPNCDLMLISHILTVKK